MRWNRRAKTLAIAFIVLFLSEIIAPTAVFALTGGPSQPEFQSFQQVGDMQMVDLFTGDFKHNIPLFDIGGYPINLNYSAGIGMEQEASWVGLGWNLTPGMISRSVRGLPDDFNGEDITENYHMKKEIDIMVDAGLLLELIGKEVDTEGGGGETESQDAEQDPNDTSNVVGKLKSKLKPSFGLTFNFNSNRGFSIGGSGALSIEDINTGTAGAGLSYTPAGGLNLVPTIGLGPAYSDPNNTEAGMGAAVSLSYNSRNGLQNISATYSGKLKEKPEDKNFQRMMPHTATIPINEYSYFPYSKPLLQYLSSAFNTKIGGDIISIDGDISMKGSYAETSIAQETVSTKAYGYIYLQNRTAEDLCDFNRDGDASAFYPGQNHLMPTNMMPDIYAVTGHGMAGSLRPYRMETGTVSEPAFSNISSFGANLGIEGATGNTQKGGWDTKTYDQYLEGQPWKNAVSNYADFENHPKNTLEQNIVFRHANEVAPVMDDYLAEIGDEEPVAFGLSGIKNVVNNPYPQRLQYDVDDPYQRISRQQEVSLLTAAEANNAGLDKTIKNYTSEGDLSAVTNIGRTSGTRKDYHLSQIACSDRGGARYVYGIPAMNNLQKEVMFNAASNTVNGDQVAYSLQDASTGNDSGNDHYYYSKEVPAYAHSYLLTAWLSADYIDISEDGVTDDDYGNAVKFNWQKIHDNYGWRTPFAEGKAYHAKQSLVSAEDDRGSYSYGTKEIWHVHSIESKDQVAFFYTSSRSDALGVADEYGVAGTDSLRKLDSIRVYSKKAWNALGSAAEPIKTIAFEYDYSLCQGTPNAQSGKLTLKRLYISHGNSTKGRQSPYVFSYGYNPAYNSMQADRWGYYRGQNTKNLDFDSYPYVNEEVPQDSADVWASAWNMDQITLSTGAQYTVTYEADEYAWVQDKPAQQMYHIVGLGSGTAFGGGRKLYKNSVSSSLDYNHLYIENPAFSEVDTEEELDGLIAGLKDDLMYFKMRVTLLPEGMSQFHDGYDSEFIRGYAKVLDIGFCDGTTDKIWIEVEAVDFDEKGNEMNPFLKASLDYIYTSHQDLIFGGIHPNDNQVVKFVKNLITIKDDLISLILGPYKLMLQKGMAKSFDKTESIVRLNHPNGEKRGGGHRVKRIEINDQWNALTGSSEEYSTITGQDYFYDLANGTTSGVAQYEPSKGNDENPFKYPEYYKIGSSKSKKAKPSVFQEGPFGESFFPSATVGYGKVTVRNINAQTAKTAGTYSIHEFHTARDFPFQHAFTDIEIEQDKEKPLWAFFGYGKTKRYTSTSQGYVFVFNDMHGKKKKETVYMEQVGFAGELLRSSEYVYQTGTDTTELNNSVKCIDRYGNYDHRNIGVEAEISVDTWETFDEATDQTLQPNFSGFNIIIPGLIPPIWYTNSSELKEYRTIVTSKFIQKQGLLKKVIETNRDFTTTMENQVWDSHSGEVVLTSHTTEYHQDGGRKDIQYAWSYPAYWSEGNDRMGHAYRNNAYIGDVGAPFQFMDATQYDALDTQEKIDLKGMIYRGLCDGLDDSLYLALTGNIVQGGVFAEGDEVYEATTNEVYHAEEVLTYEDVTTILSMSGIGAGGAPPMNTSGGSSIGPAGQSGLDTTGNSGSGSGTIYEPCGNVVVTDPTMWACYQTMLGIANSTTLNLSYMPLLDTTPQLIADYLTSPYWQEWYGMWHDPSYEPLYHLLDEMLNETAIQNVLIDIYNDPDKRAAYYNLFQCNELLSCLMSNSTNSSVINGFQALMASPTRLNLAAAMGNHYTTHYVVTFAGVTAGNQWLTNANPQPGCFDNNELINGKIHRVINFMGEDTCAQIADYGSYEHFFGSPQSYAIIQNLPDTSTYNCSFSEINPLGSNNDTNGVIEDCANILSYNLFSFPQNCNNYYEDGSTAGGGVTPNDSTDTLNQHYNLPQYDELVLFMDHDGNIIDLNGKEVKILRSGRRNVISAGAGEVLALNGNHFDSLGVAGASVEGVLNASFMTWTDDWASDYMPVSATDSRFNPFVYGQRGVFRPKATYAAHGARDNAANKTRMDGTLEDYVPFWDFPLDSNNVPFFNRVVSSVDQNAEDYWLRTENINFYSGTGTPIERMNALGIYSALAVERNNHVEIEAVNARHRNLFFENFEYTESDNGMVSSNQMLANTDRIKYLPHTGGPYIALDSIGRILYEEEAHSGNSCIALRGAYDINGPDPLNDRPKFILFDIPLDSSGSTYDSDEYRISGCRPQPGSTMVLSLWMKSFVHLRDNVEYTNNGQPASFSSTFPLGYSRIDCYENNAVVSQHSNWYPTGISVDGWVRLETEFTIPANSDRIRLYVWSIRYGALVDDIRIFPVGAQSVAHVFSGQDDRLKARLDDNNYATFYKYDQEGRLIKLERETETGRLTVKESEQNTAKTQQ